ncbi:MAG: MATE family efflux transporter [Actinomycetaceae bacterium]|nr:MATE family efflux transporter [Actinomycetaceae bacterium]
MSVDMSRHFSLGALLRFTAPTIAMMLVMSFYTIVDGFFVSRYIGSTALAAVNFAWPLHIILGTIGFMIGTGGTAIISATRGSGDEARARQQFSLLVYVALAAGVIAAIFGLLTLRPALSFLGAQGDLLNQSYAYGIIITVAVPALIAQYMFQTFFIAAGKPKLGFAVTIVSGIANIVLDYILIIPLDMGIVGAAIGTASAEAVGGIIPLIYFASKNSSFLRLGRTHFDGHTIIATIINGSSEMVSNIAMSVVTVAYNVQLLRYLGENGVAAYSLIMYAAFGFSAISLGFVTGSSPLMSFQWGAKNRVEMQSLFRLSLRVLAVAGVVMFVVTQLVARPLAQFFVGYDAALTDLTVHAARIFSLVMPTMGFNLYASALFTALENGKISALLTFVRVLICEISAVFLLPLAFGGEGIWFSAAVAEIPALALSFFFIWRLRGHYGYLPVPSRRCEEGEA